MTEVANNNRLPNSDNDSSNENNTLKDEICRYCRQKHSQSNPLYYPCKCSGSMKFVHETCLDTWLKTSGNTKCEVCSYQFKFQPVWRNNTPDYLPVSEIVQGILKSFRNFLLVGFHKIAMILIWIILLPLCVRLVYNIAFPISTSDHSPASVFFTLSKLSKFFGITLKFTAFDITFADWFTGLTILFINAISVIAMLYLREQLHQVVERNREEEHNEIFQEFERNIRFLREQRHENLNRINKVLNLFKNTKITQTQSEPQQPSTFTDDTESINSNFKIDPPTSLNSKNSQPFNQQNFENQSNSSYSDNSTDSDIKSEESSINFSENIEPPISITKLPNPEITLPNENPSISNSDNQELDYITNFQNEDNTQNLQQIQDNLKKMNERLAQMNNNLNNDNLDSDDEGEILPVREEGRNRQANHPLQFITWQRVFGLDGSYRFLEYAFYAFLLNGLVLWVLWYVPIWIGKTLLNTILSIPFDKLNIFKYISPIQHALYLILGYISITTGLGVLGKLKKIYYVRKRLQYLHMFSNLSESIYIWLKVAILMLIEILIYPALVGFWVDVCSINLIGWKLTDRCTFFLNHPIFSIMMHWAIGMFTIFQFVNGILAIRKSTRRGLIWFVRNMDDVDYSPLKDMLEGTSLMHIKRFVYTCVLLGWATVVCLWLPTQFASFYNLVDLPFFKDEDYRIGHLEHDVNDLSYVNLVYPIESNFETCLNNNTILNYNTCSTDIHNPINYNPQYQKLKKSKQNFSERKRQNTQLEEELVPKAIHIIGNIAKNTILMQVIYPMLTIDGHRFFKTALDKLIELWCILVGTVLGLKSYLLGIEKAGDDETGEHYQPEIKRLINNRNRERMGQRNENPGGGQPFIIDPYRRKGMFHLRIVVFMLSLIISLSTTFCIIMFLPLKIGRYSYDRAIKLLIGNLETKSLTNRSIASDNDVILPWLIGICIIITPINITTGLVKFIKSNYNFAANHTFREFAEKIIDGFLFVVKNGLFLVITLGCMPSLIGIYANCAITSLFRQNTIEDHLVFTSNYWILGLLLQKVSVVSILIIPHNYLRNFRRDLLRIYVNGEPDFKRLAKVCLIVVHFMILSRAIPIFIGHKILPHVPGLETSKLLKHQKTIFATIIKLLIGGTIAKWNLEWFHSLSERLRQNRYMVSNRLLNRRDDD